MRTKLITSIKNFSFLYLLLSSFLVFSQKKNQNNLNDPENLLIQHKINVRIKVPKGFSTIPKEELIRKEFSFITPSQAYTSSDKRADLFIKETPCLFPEEDADLMLKFYKSNLSSFFDKIDWIESSSIKIKGKKFIRLVFVSYTKPPKNHINRRKTIKKYTIIHTKIIEDKKVNIIFTFPANEKKSWLSIAEKTMRSIRL